WWRSVLPRRCRPALHQSGQSVAPRPPPVLSSAWRLAPASAQESIQASARPSPSGSRAWWTPASRSQPAWTRSFPWPRELRAHPAPVASGQQALPSAEHLPAWTGPAWSCSQRLHHPPRPRLSRSARDPGSRLALARSSPWALARSWPLAQARRSVPERLSPWAPAHLLARARPRFPPPGSSARHQLVSVREFPLLPALPSQHLSPLAPVFPSLRSP